MCWKCENPNGTEEKYLDELRRMMRDHHGWQVQFVDHDKRPFAYAVGLHDRGLPELLITGLNAYVSNRVLKSTGHMIVDDGTPLAPAMHIDYQDRFSSRSSRWSTRTYTSSTPSRSAARTCAPCNWCGPMTAAGGPGTLGGATADAGSRWSGSAPRWHDASNSARVRSACVSDSAHPPRVDQAEHR